MAGKPSATVISLRNSKARRRQNHPPDHPRVTVVAQALDYELLAEHAERVVSNWPEPTMEQRARLRQILGA